MTREQLMGWCRTAGKVGTVEHTDYIDYVIVMTNRKKGDDGWVNTESPYMQVDGKVAMARADHRNQTKRLDFSEPHILADNGDILTLSVTVESEVYGKTTGTATSRKNDGTPSEKQFPYETAETSALGRALAALGYGLFSGSGLSSAEDMKRASQRAPQTAAPTGERSVTPKTSATTSDTASKSSPPISTVQKNKLVELWTQVYGQGDTVAALKKHWLDEYKKDIANGTYEEAARLTGRLLSELRNKPSESKEESK